MKTIKKSVSILLAVIMVFGLFTIVPFSAGALDAVPYIDANGNEQACTEYTVLTNDTTKEISDGWYVINSDLEIRTLTCIGDVHLIVCDGCRLNDFNTNVLKHIVVSEGNSLTIYGQAEGTGRINVVGYNYAAIGGTEGVANGNSGVITINGGTITARGTGAFTKAVSSCIGGAVGGTGTVVINGGTIKTKTPRNTSSIGGGGPGLINKISAAPGYVTINGGVFEEEESGSNGSRIGGGLNNAGGTVTLNWNNLNTQIKADWYAGTVTIEKPFTDGTDIFAEGEVSDNSILSEKTLVPAAHTVTWNNEDGSTIDTTIVAYGEAPTHEAPTKADDEQNSYTFAGWKNGDTTYAPGEPLPEVTGDTTYTAQFTATAKTFKAYALKLTGETYTIENLTGETTVAQLKEIIADQIDIPATAQRLIFSGKQLEDAKTLAEYNIGNESTIHLIIRGYTVTWLNYDNSELGTTTVQYGATPSYDGETPTKPEDETNTYTFAGWKNGDTTYAPGEPLPEVTGDTTYTAQFTADPKAHVLSSQDGVLLIDGVAATQLEFEYEGQIIDCYYLPAGNYVLQSDIAVGRTTMINSGSVNLDIGAYNWTNNNSKGFGAGAFAVNGGIFTFDGTTGVISGQNNNLSRGGGVLAYAGTTVMKGGKISGCNVAIGAAVYCYGSSLFEMQGGEISGNSGWGAIVLQSNFRMSGGTITDNTDCGVQVWGGSHLYLSGNPVISGNKNADGDECNINLGENGIITVEGEFTDGASVGITKPNEGVFTSGFAANNTVDPCDVFTPDDSIGSKLTKSTGGESQLEFYKCTATFVAGEGSGSIDAREVKKGLSLNLPTSGFTAPEGKMLSGWLSSSDNQVYDPGASVTMTEDTTFTAQWKPGFHYMFDFEDGVPADWQINGTWYLKTNGGDYDLFPAHSGNQNMTYFANGFNTTGDLITSAFDLSKAESSTLGFWYTNRSWGGDTDQLVVSYRIGDGEWVQLFATSGNHESWTNEVINLPAECLAENVQFRFKANGNFGYGIALDDVDISAVTGLIVAHSLTLKGDIGINFYIDPSAAGMTAEDVNSGNFSYSFAWADGNALVDVEKQAQSQAFTVENGLIKVTCKVCAAEMSCGVNASFTLGDKSDSEVYSVRKYCENVLDPESKFSVGYKAKNGTDKYNDLVDLVKKMLDYGTKAQTTFGIKTDDPANSIVTGYTMQNVTDKMFTDAIQPAEGTDISANNIAADTPAGAAFKTSSLVFLTQNTLRLYFEKTGDSFNTSGLTKWNDYYYAQVADIPAAELDTLQVFNVSGKTLYYSAFDYAKLLLNTSNADIAKALYWYNQAANKFF